MEVREDNESSNILEKTGEEGIRAQWIVGLRNVGTLFYCNQREDKRMDEWIQIHPAPGWLLGGKKMRAFLSAFLEKNEIKR